VSKAKLGVAHNHVENAGLPVARAQAHRSFRICLSLFEATESIFGGGTRDIKRNEIRIDSESRV
jgi:hypothetical protein